MRYLSDIISWAMSHFGWGSRVEELRHAVDLHWRIGGTELMQRALRKRGDASTFYYINDKELEKIFAFFLQTKEHQRWLLKWMNNKSDFKDMVFIHNFGRKIGICYRYETGKCVVCRRAVFIVRKTNALGLPKVISAFPVPKDYEVYPEKMASRYAE